LRGFARLYEALDGTTSTNEKVDALATYFSEVPDPDGAWAVFFLVGERLKRLVATRVLREQAAAAAGVAPWLFEECYRVCGDLAETAALLVPEGAGRGCPDRPLHVWIEGEILGLRDRDEPQQAAMLRGWWEELRGTERFLLNKLLTGALRVGVSRGLVARALARVAGVEAATILHRLAGNWEPSASAWRALIGEATAEDDLSKPYPFLLAAPLQAEPEALGPIEDWAIEWKWDGIRAQVLHRGGEIAIWTRGEELVTERYPEVAAIARRWPAGSVLDGEILAWRGDAPLPFAVLQRRIGRQRPGRRILEEAPVSFLAYDLLEERGADLRDEPLRERRRRLAALAEATTTRLSAPLEPASWHEARELRHAARERGTEGLVIKRLDSRYGVGRRRGRWWKWKVDALTVDAVLIYAQAGHGRRANLFTDYTLAVWNEGELVPVAKAYSGLSDAELRTMDRWIRRHTTERFGPVRSVEPVQVFEIAFDSIRSSRRHKAGLALRFPRILRRRQDKPAADADTLETLQQLLETTGA
jgi:DNA ligase-1